MRNDTPLSRMLHVLIHIEQHEQALTSQTIAQMLDTNPVVVVEPWPCKKSTGMCRLKRVAGEDGRSPPFSEIDLLDVHQAMGSGCVCIGHGFRAPSMSGRASGQLRTLRGLAAAHTLLSEQLGNVTLSQVKLDYERRLESTGAMH